MLSHELRTPLTPVLATVSMLQQQPRFDADDREHLEVIRRNVELEGRLINDLLDVTRITHGKVDLDRRPVDLRTVLHRAIEVCKPDIEARKLHFGVDMAPDEPCVVEADAARLQQVFWNLLKNSIKFTAEGGCVGIKCYRSDEATKARSDDGKDQAVPSPSSLRRSVAPSLVRVEVSDSGVGIEPDALSRIFNAFEQAERSITRQYGGLGLGLTISKAMVELHGGTIEAQSEGKGKGATFIVKLPLVKSDASRVISEAPRQDSLLVAPDSSPPRALRILLVEDHGDTARIMRRILESDGHDVQMAADVATALKLAGEFSFDLLLSDLGLPDGSGLELMRALRARGLKLPGIALTGYGQESDIALSRAAGFAVHITKPINPKQLASAIAAVAGGGEIRQRTTDD